MIVFWYIYLIRTLCLYLIFVYNLQFLILCSIEFIFLEIKSIAYINEGSSSRLSVLVLWMEVYMIWKKTILNVNCRVKTNTMYYAWGRMMMLVGIRNSQVCNGMKKKTKRDFQIRPYTTLAPTPTFIKTTVHVLTQLRLLVGNFIHSLLFIVS